MVRNWIRRLVDSAQGHDAAAAGAVADATAPYTIAVSSRHPLPEKATIAELEALVGHRLPRSAAEAAGKDAAAARRHLGQPQDRLLATPADLWFDLDSTPSGRGPVSRRGEVLYVSLPGEVWAVFRYPRLFPDDLLAESAELLAHYGATVGGVGYQLAEWDVPLPPSLEQWATARTVPAADLGGWAPCLVSIDGRAQLALSRDFDGVRAFATTVLGDHVSIFTPSAHTTAALVHGTVDARPSGWDQQGRDY